MDKKYRLFTNTKLLVYFYYENADFRTKSDGARESITEGAKREKTPNKRFKRRTTKNGEKKNERRKKIEKI